MPVRTELQPDFAVFVHSYKELSEVERGFRSLKDVLEMRPIYHQRESRVRAHNFVAALAFLLERVLERKLKESGTDLSVSEALQALKTIGVVEFDVEGRSMRGLPPNLIYTPLDMTSSGCYEIRKLGTEATI